MSTNAKLLRHFKGELQAFYMSSVTCSINWVTARDYERNLKWIAAYLIGNGVDNDLTTLKFEYHREQ